MVVLPSIISNALRANIIATLGPASQNFETMEELAKNGVGVFRLNFSHGTHQSQGKLINTIKRLNKKLSHPCAIMLDTKGPEIRSGDLQVPIEVKVDDRLVFSLQAGDYKKTGKIGVNYDAFIDDVKVGEKILLDSGLINLTVLEKNQTDIICQVHDQGVITSRRHINLPGREVSLESITDQDWRDIDFGIKQGVDFIALSFVRTAQDIQNLRQYLKKKKAKIGIIAKIESFQATQNLSEICQAADSLMIARGDLGAEVPLEQLPRLQREISHLASEFGKPVIVATHMLETMIENPVPTRAEVTDIATAAWQRVDSVMLSGETANGQYPIKSVETMAKIVQATEYQYLPTRPIRDLRICNPRGIFGKTACQMAQQIDNLAAILVITRSGNTAELVAKFRPKVPIMAFTNKPDVRRKLQLLWGTKAFRIEFSATPEITIKRAEESLLKNYPTLVGQSFVLVSDSLVDNNFVPTLQVRTL